MLNNELNIEKLLKEKEDKKYKKTSISAQSQTGDKDISYPTVGAVRDFVNYVKEDLEGYIDDSISDFEKSLEEKTNYISETYKNIDKCTRMDTIYVINGIPNEAEILETGILLTAKVADNCAQYLFTNTGRFLIRQKINGEWNEKFTDVIPYGCYQDVQYKTQQIIGTTSPGHDIAYYPSVGAVKEYVKAYYEDIMDSISEISDIDLSVKEDVKKRTSIISDSTTIAYDKTHYPNVYAIKNAGFKKNFYDKKEILHQNSPQEIITGTYRLADDLCTIVGKAKVKAGELEMIYELPTPVIHNAATISINGSNCYTVNTEIRENSSILRIANITGGNITENATIQFIITYKYI